MDDFTAMNVLITFLFLRVQRRIRISYQLTTAL